MNYKESWEAQLAKAGWSEIPEIACFSHRHHPEYFSNLLSSLGLHTKGTYRILMSVAPGRCLESQNRALSQSWARRLIIVDEDIQLLANPELTDSWLDILLKDLEENPYAAIVGAGEVKTEQEKFDYENGLMDLSDTGVKEVRWTPCFMWAIARDRIPTLWNDDTIPGQKGLHDLSICLDVAKAGLKVMVDSRVCVFHPHKQMSDMSRKELQNPTLSEELEVFPKQVAWATKKYGKAYLDTCPTAWREDILPSIRKAFEEINEPCPW